jgi:hypothetical protein
MTDVARDLAADLAAWEEGDLDEELARLADASVDAELADRILGRIARLEAQVEGVANMAALRIAQVRAWQDEREGVLRRQIKHLAGLLDGWTRANEARTGAVTVKLPNGELKLRPGSPSFVCPDPEALWKWCVDEGRHSDGWVGYEVVYRADGARLRHQLNAGAPLGPPDEKGLVDHEAIDPATGERVPHVVIRLPERKKFSYRTARHSGP